MLSRIGVELCRGCGDRYSDASACVQLTLIDQVYPQAREERENPAVGSEVPNTHRMVAHEYVLPRLIPKTVLIVKDRYRSDR
jgi:hypothetical protein